MLFVLVELRKGNTRLNKVNKLLSVNFSGVYRGQRFHKINIYYEKIENEPLLDNYYLFKIEFLEFKNKTVVGQIISAKRL